MSIPGKQKLFAASVGRFGAGAKLKSNMGSFKVLRVVSYDEVEIRAWTLIDEIRLRFRSAGAKLMEWFGL